MPRARTAFRAHRCSLRDQAMATVAALANVRFVVVSGNHITMIFGDDAHQIIEVMTAFLHEGHEAIANDGPSVSA